MIRVEMANKDVVDERRRHLHCDRIADAAITHIKEEPSRLHGAVARVISFPVATSHSWIAPPLLLPPASRLPSGLKATEVKMSPCPRRVLSSLPVETSHILAE